MHSTKRATWRIYTIGTLVLGALLFAAGAEANDRNRGERISDRLDWFVLVAAISGDHQLAYSLNRRGERIEHRYHAREKHMARPWRRPHRRHQHHFVGCGHSEWRHRARHHDRLHPYLDTRRHHSRHH